MAAQVTLFLWQRCPLLPRFLTHEAGPPSFQGMRPLLAFSAVPPSLTKLMGRRSCPQKHPEEDGGGNPGAAQATPSPGLPRRPTPARASLGAFLRLSLSPRGVFRCSPRGAGWSPKQPGPHRDGARMTWSGSRLLPQRLRLAGPAPRLAPMAPGGGQGSGYLCQAPPPTPRPSSRQQAQGSRGAGHLLFMGSSRGRLPGGSAAA